MVFLRTAASSGLRGARKAASSAKFHPANIDIVGSPRLKAGEAILIVANDDVENAAATFEALKGYAQATGKGTGGGQLRVSTFGGCGGGGWIEKLNLEEKARTALLTAGTVEMLLHLAGMICNASENPKQTVEDFWQKFKPIDPAVDKAHADIEYTRKVADDVYQESKNLGEQIQILIDAQMGKATTAGSGSVVVKPAVGKKEGEKEVRPNDSKEEKDDEAVAEPVVVAPDVVEIPPVFPGVGDD